MGKKERWLESVSDCWWCEWEVFLGVVFEGEEGGEGKEEGDEDDSDKYGGDSDVG